MADMFFGGENGKKDAAIVGLKGRTYAMGIQVSGGYREYKMKLLKKRIPEFLPPIFWMKSDVSWLKIQSADGLQLLPDFH